MNIRWSLATAIFTSLFTTAVASAFSVSPLHWQMTIDPGKEQIITATVQNTETTANTFTVVVGGVKQNDHGQPVFGSGYDVAEQWIFPQTKSFTLAPNEKKKIAVIVHPTSNAEPGTHYAALFIKKKSGESGTVGVAGQTAILVAINVAGVVHEGLSINTWTVEKSVATTPLWKTQVELQNTGTVSLPLSGTIVVRNWRGQTVAEQTLSLGTIVVPGAKRSIAPTITGAIFWPGPYRADSIVVYGHSQAMARATQTIWYIPAWSIGVVLVVIISILLAVHFKKRTGRRYE